MLTLPAASTKPKSAIDLEIASAPDLKLHLRSEQLTRNVQQLVAGFVQI